MFHVDFVLKWLAWLSEQTNKCIHRHAFTKHTSLPVCQVIAAGTRRDSRGSGAVWYSYDTALLSIHLSSSPLFGTSFEIELKHFVS